jgi:hypothetical protein
MAITQNIERAKTQKSRAPSAEHERQALNRLLLLRTLVHRRAGVARKHGRRRTWHGFVHPWIGRAEDDGNGIERARTQDPGAHREKRALYQAFPVAGEPNTGARTA